MFCSKRLVRLSSFSKCVIQHRQTLRSSSSSSKGQPWKEPEIELVGDLPHTPVLLDETLFYLDVKPGQRVLDMTFGAGGHSRKLLEKIEGVTIFALDRDPVAHQHAQDLSSQYPEQVFPLLGKFSEVKELMATSGTKDVDAILFDFGCSSMQFDTPERGFAISKDGPLDMRMDGNRSADQPTAAQVLQHMDEDDLARIFKVYGEEKNAKRIARAIVEARYMLHPLDTTSQFAELVSAVLEKSQVMDKLQRPAHVATKTFQALRIFINNELNEINRGLELAHELLKTNGTLVTLTFHSLEDRIVKRHMLGIDMDDPIEQRLGQKYINSMLTPTEMDMASSFTHKWSVVTKHVVNPTFYEVQKNPRARSAKLRCATKN